MNERMYYSQEAEQRAQRERLMLVLLVSGLSIGIGTLLGLMFAPQSGDKIRGKLSEQVNETLEKGRKAAETAGEQLIENAGKVREDLNERLQAKTK